MEEENPPASITEGEGGSEDVTGHFPQDNHELSLFLYTSMPIALLVPKADGEREEKEKEEG